MVAGIHGSIIHVAGGAEEVKEGNDKAAILEAVIFGSENKSGCITWVYYRETV